MFESHVSDCQTSCHPHRPPPPPFSLFPSATSEGTEVQSHTRSYQSIPNAASLHSSPYTSPCAGSVDTCVPCPPPAAPIGFPQTLLTCRSSSSHSTAATHPWCPAIPVVSPSFRLGSHFAPRSYALASPAPTCTPYAGMPWCVAHPAAIPLAACQPPVLAFGGKTTSIVRAREMQHVYSRSTHTPQVFGDGSDVHLSPESSMSYLANATQIAADENATPAVARHGPAARGHAETSDKQESELLIEQGEAVRHEAVLVLGEGSEGSEGSVWEDALVLEEDGSDCDDTDMMDIALDAFLKLAFTYYSECALCHGSVTDKFDRSRLQLRCPSCLGCRPIHQAAALEMLSGEFASVMTSSVRAGMLCGE
jgi:hypothetical protein